MTVGRRDIKVPRRRLPPWFVLWSVMKMTALYGNVKQLCKERKISLRALQRELGFPDGTISNWMHALPNCTKVLAVAQYFDVSVDYLLGNSAIRAPYHDAPAPAKDIFEAAVDLNVDARMAKVVIDLMKSLAGNQE